MPLVCEGIPGGNFRLLVGQKGARADRQDAAESGDLDA